MNASLSPIVQLCASVRLRGCLFYGPPGTGKTLVARALANECSSVDRKVSFFMRRGADCLSKWVGESERQLRLLFEQVTAGTRRRPFICSSETVTVRCVAVCRPQAYQLRPSIIFFDEIDGLAPVRSSRQDQIHRSEPNCRTRTATRTAQTCHSLSHHVPQLHRVHAAGSDGRLGQSQRGRGHRSNKPVGIHRPGAATARTL